MLGGSVVWAQEEVRVCSVLQLGGRSVAVEVTGFDMAETPVGIDASCMLMVPDG